MTDARARAEAADPQRSVIVQAPAGSGKTTLLVERYLGLLAAVDAPENILAITFTRKAAAQMRQRVLRYLDPDFSSEAPHEQGPLARARAIADKVAGWGLRENPQRLLIRTIDSFNHYLARTMPVVSALGPVPAPAENTQALYRQAARNVLSLVDGADDIATDLQRLLDWRDHRSRDIENLLSNLLARRDQWLRALQVAGPARRGAFERVLSQVVLSQLRHAASEFEQALTAAAIDRCELLDLLQGAARTLIAENRQSPIQAYAEAEKLPEAVVEDLPLWRGLAALLLTKDKPNFRTRISVNEGFLPKSQEKERFTALFDDLRAHPQIAQALHITRALPEPKYSDDEWAVLASLIRVLGRTAAELQLVFARSGQSDFTGLAAAALHGLGDEVSGFTDLGLYLDRRIQHILVDEFQDTNWGQLHLLEKLTYGWEPGDGRTLFLVGDPMQSIYRFREAEVGLFIRCRDQGVGAVTLESKQLQRNFRSRSEIVTWVNERLGPIFPGLEDISSGAISYAPSQAGRGEGGRVQLMSHASDAAEAQAIADLLQRQLQIHASDPEFKAAVVVRARSHLADIIPELIRRRIPYRAVKLDPLLSRPVVQDLLALTRAIVLPCDTTALLSVLRSPVCGLTLAELHVLAWDGHVLTDPDILARLSGEARARAARVLTTLRDAQRLWRARPLRDLVEGAWQRLGGPDCSADPRRDRAEANLYLNALELADTSGLLEDWNDFLELLAQQHTEGDPPSADVKLEILTIHGAKGLEWDLVVLPGLNRRPPGGGDRTLLHWLPFTGGSEAEQILLAPLRSAEQALNPPLVQLIRREQKIREDFENQRLLYVATTRARQQLVLSACLDPEQPRPIAGTLLADLWPTCSEEFSASARTAPGAGVTGGDPGMDDVPRNALPDQSLRRVDINWQPPVGERLPWQPVLEPSEPSQQIEYNWAGMQARRTGTVLHRLLEQAGRLGVEALQADQRQRLIHRIPQLLGSMGTRDQDLEQATDLVRNTFEDALDREPGRWILSNQHQQAACELPITGLLDGRLVNAVIDRTFIDTDGVRWIIDYKSGYHAGADLEQFLREEGERYREQLQRYRRLFQQLEDREVKTALYLPRHGRLLVVDP